MIPEYFVKYNPPEDDQDCATWVIVNSKNDVVIEHPIEYTNYYSRVIADTETALLNQQHNTINTLATENEALQKQITHLERQVETWKETERQTGDIGEEIAGRYATENAELTRRVAELEVALQEMAEINYNMAHGVAGRSVMKLVKERDELKATIEAITLDGSDYENITAPSADDTQPLPEAEAVQPLDSEVWQAEFSPAGYSYVKNIKTGEVMHEKFKWFEDAERRARQQNTTESATDA